MGLRRWIWIIAIAAVAAFAVMLGYRKQPVAVEIASIQKGQLRVTVDEEGKTRVLDRYVVSAPVAGYAERVRLKVGDAVTDGQIVCWLQPPRSAVLDTRSHAEQTARVKAAEAALQSAEEQVKVAAADEAYWRGQRERMSTLSKTGDVAREVLDRAESEARRFQASRQSAEHVAAQARAELEAARATLRYSAAAQPSESNTEKVAVRAPARGRVLRVMHESEGAVTPGQPLLEVGNAHALEVEVELLSADAVRVETGMKVLFERWGGEKPLEGHVRRVEPVAFTKISALGVEEQRVLVLVTITSPFEQWRRLGDQYRVEASFILWEADSVLLVPASSLFRQGENWTVFVVEGEIARYRTVQVGQRNARFAEVLSGLKEGDRVIVHPDDTVEEGVQVTER